MIPRRLVVSVLVLVSIALAQVDDGVRMEVNESTGEPTCSQVVFLSTSNFTGIRLLIENGRLRTALMRGNAEEDAFSRFGAAEGASVFVRWPDGTVKQYDVEANQYSQDIRVELVVIEASSDVYAALASPGDLLVRFSGSQGEFDFTIPHSILKTLANGFAKQCLD